MIEDCKNCGPLSEIALVTDDQSVKRKTREGAVIAWNCEQNKLWDDKTEEAFNRIMLGGVE